MTSITVNATGGVAPYTYNMNGGAYVTSNVFSGLTAGMYVVSVKDANGEMFYASCITVNAAPSVIKITGLTVGACANGMAALTAAATGGTGTLQYSIDGGVSYQSTGAFTGIASGTSVTITVKDANGCTTTSPMMMVNCGTSSSIVVNVASGECLNNSTTLTATATGGVAPYTYSLDGGAFATNSVFTGVVSGNHTITAKDANGATGTYNALLSLSCGACPPSYTATAALSSQILCNGGTTSLTATAAGGVAPYTYSLNGGAYVSTNVFTGLLAGAYVVTVKDANGTTATAASVTVAAAPAAISVNAAAGVCVGGLATVTATATGGTGPFQFSINGGATYQSSGIFTGIATGTNVTVTVRDANGCTATSAAVQVSCVVTPGCPTILATTSINGQLTCNGGTVSLTVTAGNGVAPYSYSIDGGVTFQTSNVFNGLTVGIYTVIVRDANLCTGLAAPVTVSLPLNCRITIVASPNPYNDMVRFVIQSNIAGPATLDVFNVLGQKLATVFKGTLPVGTTVVKYFVPGGQRINLVYALHFDNDKLTGKLLNSRG
jgi:hypothetical protein